MIPANSTKIPHTNHTLISQRSDCQADKLIYIYCTAV